MGRTGDSGAITSIPRCCHLYDDIPQDTRQLTFCSQDTKQARKSGGAHRAFRHRSLSFRRVCRKLLTISSSLNIVTQLEECPEPRGPRGLCPSPAPTKHTG